MYKNLSEPILITGTTGFIGSNLLRKLVLQKKYTDIHIIIRKKSSLWRINDIKKNCKIHILDLTQEKKIRKVIKNIKPKTIFHLSTYGAYAHQNHLNEIKKNILDATINLLNECLKYKFKIFINTGSNSEYGFKKKKMKEIDILEPNSYYSIFKAATTHYCQFMASKSKLKIITLRPFHIYGPYEERTRLIPTIIDNLLSHRSPRLVDPLISRDMIYVDEVVDLYIKIASKPYNNNDILNIGSGNQYNIKKIFETISKLLKSNVVPDWNTMKNRDWDQNIWISDINKLKKQYKWKQKISLKEGLRRTISWHKNYYFESC